MPADRRLRGAAVQRHGAAEEVAGVEVAEHQVGVGHRRPLAAAPVARGAGLGARALRAHLGQAHAVDVRDRAAAGADLDELDDRHQERQPAAALEAPHARHLELARDLRLAVVDEADLGGGAAHVEGEHAGGAGGARVVRGGRGAAGRSGLHQPDRDLARRLDGAGAAAREHQQELAGEALGAQLLAQRAEVALHHAEDVGVGDRGGGALVLADLARDHGRQRHAQPGRALPQPSRHRLLVGGIAVGVEQRDGDGLDARRPQALDDGVHLGRGERRALAAVGQHPRAEAQAQAGRHQRLRLLEGEVVGVVAGLAPDLEGVLVAGGGDEPGRRALALDERVGDERGAVDDVAHLARAHARPGQGTARPVHHRGRGVLGGREDLLHDGGRAAGVEEHDVGEGPADVHGQMPVAHDLV